MMTTTTNSEEEAWAQIPEAGESIRIRLTVAYDGRSFSGWQSQPCGNTIQDHLEGALGAACGLPAEDRSMRVQGSGRTDAGVHALGQVAHFDAPLQSQRTAEAWARSLNANLPPSIRVLSAAEVPSDFHARFSAIEKTYRYEIWLGEVLPPSLFGTVGHRQSGVDTGLLEKVMQSYLGTHDFARLSAKRGNEDPENPPDTRRNITGISMRVENDEELPGGEMISLRVSGEGFLYKMVRMMVGTALRVAEGKLTRAELKAMMAEPDGDTTHHCATAAGLTLLSVDYQDDGDKSA